MQLFYAPNIEFESFLDENDSKHCIRVLRKKKNDLLHLVDGKGNFFETKITEEHPKKCHFEIISTWQELSSSRRIEIAISPTKNSDRIEYFVEKCVEIGISQITLLSTQNSERKYQKIDRLEKIAISAMKQSLKATLPAISEIIPFQEFVKKCSSKTRCIAHLSETSLPLRSLPLSENCTILIGPEGDFTENEIEIAKNSKFQEISLGISRLRTETAGVVACTLLNLLP